MVAGYLGTSPQPSQGATFDAAMEQAKMKTQAESLEAFVREHHRAAAPMPRAAPEPAAIEGDSEIAMPIAR